MSQIVADSVGNQAALVNALSQAGARYILVPNIPDLGMTPEFSGSPISAGIATLLSDSYNQAFTQQLATSSANIIPLNVSALLHEVAADPQAYGFSNVNTAACAPPPIWSQPEQINTICLPTAYTPVQVAIARLLTMPMLS